MKFDGISQKLQDAAAAMLAGKKAEVIAEEKKHPADCTCADCKKHSKNCDCAKCKAMKEEVENIDEISKKTLGSYVNKASHDLSKQWYKHGENGSGDIGKIVNRTAGIKKAVGKLTKEEFEAQISEMLGLVDLTEEELTELSKATLGSYINKAHKSGSKANANMSVIAATSSMNDKGSEKTFNRNWDTNAKRIKGIARAVGKLTKEGFDPLELTIVSEEFGEGKILSINEGTATVVFIGNIVEIALDDIDIEETED